MLQWMREAQTWMIKGVLWAGVVAFVVTIFYQWGVRSSGGPTRSEVATIYDQAVNVREFQRMYNALQQRYRAILRLAMPPSPRLVAASGDLKADARDPHWSTRR